jgi:hypothetical protein
MYLSTHLDTNPKVWKSLTDFLRTEFNAHLNEDRKLVLDLPNIFVDREFVSTMPFSKDYTENEALHCFATSGYFSETMHSLHYKIYSVEKMW